MTDIIAQMTGNLHIALGAGAAAIGVGLIGTKAVEAVGRNPGASGKILVQSILGMALAEAVAFYVIFLASGLPVHAACGVHLLFFSPTPPMNLLLAATDASTKLTNLQSQFGIEGKYLLMQVISFSILAFVLYRFFFKPVLKTVDERNATISQGLQYAEETKAQLASAQQQSAVILKQAQADATKLIEEARQTAKEFSERENAAATERGNGLITKAQQAIELEHKKMLEQARTEIARLVVTTTQRVLARELSDADRSRYNEAATRELTGV